MSWDNQCDLTRVRRQSGEAARMWALDLPDWGPTSSLPLAFSSLFSLFEPQFPHKWNEDKISYLLLIMSFQWDFCVDNQEHSKFWTHADSSLCCLHNECDQYLLVGGDGGRCLGKLWVAFIQLCLFLGSYFLQAEIGCALLLEWSHIQLRG